MFEKNEKDTKDIQHPDRGEGQSCGHPECEEKSKRAISESSALYDRYIVELADKADRDLQVEVERLVVKGFKPAHAARIVLVAQTRAGGHFRETALATVQVIEMADKMVPDVVTVKSSMFSARSEAAREWVQTKQLAQADKARVVPNRSGKPS